MAANPQQPISDETRANVERALAANDIARAAAVAEAALAQGQVDPMLLNLAAWQREEEGDFAAAQGLLERAIELAPGDPLIIAAMGTVLRKQGRLREALAKFDEAISIEPDQCAAWLERGYAFEAGGSLHRATECYQKAAALDPQCAPAWAGLASVAALMGKPEDVELFARRALKIDPENVAAICAIARSAIEAGQLAAAVERLESLLGRSDLPIGYRIVAQELLGNALNRLDRRDEAYDAYRELKRIFAESYAPRFYGGGQPPSQREFITRLAKEFAGIEASAWSTANVEPISGEAGTHTFLLGYPRSGTTLVENILATAPGVEALEEHPTLGLADHTFLLKEGQLAKLAQLDGRGAAEFRADYWRKVAAAGISAACKVFVDMDPFKGIKLPVIAKLFPEARVIVMRRDPRDIVWSCFHTNFVPTASALEFTTLERAARHYDAAMTLMEGCIATLPLNLHFVVYEELVEAFDAVTKGMLDFLGLPWSPKVREFDRTAVRRGVATASMTQVRKGLYSGAGQWRRYERQMEEVLPILDPWIEKFGYER